MLTSALVAIAALELLPVWVHERFPADLALVQSQAVALADRHAGSDENVVFLWEDDAREIDDAGRVTRRFRRAMLLRTTDAVEGWGTVSWRYSPWHENPPTVRARVYRPDGRQVELDPSTTDTYPAANSEKRVYTDDQVLAAPLPGLAPGCVVIYEFVCSDHRPYFANGTSLSFGFGFTGATALGTRFSVSAPTPSPLRYRVELLPEVSPHREEHEGRVRLTFSQGVLAPVPEPQPYLPADEPRYPRVSVATGESWQKIAEGYGALLGDLLEPTDAVRTRAREIIATAETREERVHLLTRWVLDETRYTGLSFGDASLVPRLPEVCMDTGYGDCKDTASVLVALLRAIDIPAYLTLVDSGPGRELDPELPILGFDHAIVHVPGDPEYWIDTTADDHLASAIPSWNQGRWALVIAPATEGLVRIPEEDSSQSNILETRSYRMNREMLCPVAEQTVYRGAIAQKMREYYKGRDPEATASGLEKYASDVYGADVSSARAAVSESEQTCHLELHTKDTGRCVWTQTGAVVEVRFGGVVGDIPSALLDADPAARSAAVELSVAYRFGLEVVIEPPPYFEVETLPGNWSRAFGAGRMSESWERREDGAVVGLILLDTGTRHWTAADFRSFHEGLEHWGEYVRKIHFVSPFDTHLHANRTVEAASYVRAQMVDHPDDAALHACLSSAMLKAGLVESARKYARRATELDPQASSGYAALAEALERDARGHLRRPGFDLAGARAAYERAIELAPHLPIRSIALGILLEHDESGTRYADGADLDGAIAAYRAAREANPAIGFENNLMVALWFAGRIGEVGELCATLDAGISRNAYWVAAIIAETGIDAGFDKLRELAATPADRRVLTVNVGQVLWFRRSYSKARELMDRAIEDGVTGLEESRRLCAGMKAIDPPLSRLDPRDCVAHGLHSMLTRSHVDADVIAELLPPWLMESARDEPEFQDWVRLETTPRFGGTRARHNADLAIARLADSTLEGSTALGYRLRGRQGKSLTIQHVTVDTDGIHHLVAYNKPTLLLLEAQHRLNNTDLEGARQWVQWAVDLTPDPRSADSMKFDPLCACWKDSQDRPEDRVQLAIDLGLSHHADCRARLEARLEDESLEPGVRDWIERGLFKHYSREKQRVEALELNRRLLDRHPRSFELWMERTTTLLGLERMDEALLAAEALKDLLPEAGFLASLVRITMLELDGRRAEARELLDSEAQDPRVGLVFRVLSAGCSMFADDLTPRDLEWAEDGYTNAPEASLRAVCASAIAHGGPPVRAAELIRDLEDRGELLDAEEPFLIGRIADRHGEIDLAVECYERIPAEDSALSTYALAQRRLAEIREAAKTGKQGR